MTTPRLYKYATVFNARIVGMRNLWEPSREYKGQPMTKPNYLTNVIVPKTRAQWFEEPQFAGFVQACQDLYQSAMSHIPFPQVIWPVKDGDVPPEPGKAVADWSKNQWFLSGSSSSPINVEIVQNGTPVKLQNRAIVKPGDFVALSVALAVKSNDPRGVKCYVNSVLFMQPGEEIAIGNSVSGTELMQQAKAQGLNVTGFGGAGAPGGFGNPETTRTYPGGFGGAGQGQAPTGFTAPAPAQPNGASATGFGGASAGPNAFPGSPQGGFTAPAPAQPNGGFAPPAGGFQPPQGGAQGFPGR